MVDFDYAIVRWVPSVCRGEFHNVGVVLHAPTLEFLDARFCVPDGASVRLRAYIEALEHVVRGEADGGPLAALPASERFHWLTAPRSDSIQTSPPHPGRAPADELSEALNRIFAHAVSTGEHDD